MITITILALFFLVIWPSHYTLPNISIDMLNGVSLGFGATVGLIMVLGPSIIIGLSQFEKKYGESASKVINDVLRLSTDNWNKKTFILIGILFLFPLLSCFFDSTSLLIFKQIYLLSLILIVIYSCWNFYKFFENFFLIFNPSKYRDAVENLIIESIKNDSSESESYLKLLVSQRIQIERQAIKNKGNTYYEWMNNDIITFLGKVLGNESYNFSLISLPINKVKIMHRILEGHIQLIPLMSHCFSERDYVNSLQHIVMMLRNILLSNKLDNDNKEIMEVGLSLMNLYLTTALEMLDNNAITSRKLIFMARISLLIVEGQFRYRSPSIESVLNYYQSYLSFYYAAAEKNPKIFVKFVEYLNLNCFGNPVFDNLGSSMTTSNYTLIGAFKKIENNETAVKYFIENFEEEIEKINRDKSPEAMSVVLDEVDTISFLHILRNYYFYLMTIRMLRGVLAHMAYNKNFTGIIDVLNLHSPLMSNGTNVGINFISYDPLSHAMYAASDYGFFASSMDMGQFIEYFSDFIGVLILFNTYRILLKKNKLSHDNLPEGDSVKYSNAIKRLESAKDFIKHGSWKNYFQKKFSLRRSLEEIQEQAIEYINTSCVLLENAIERYKKNAPLSTEILNRYKDTLCSGNMKLFNNLPLYKACESTDNVVNPKSLAEYWNRIAFIEGTNTHYIFGGGFTMLEFLHQQTAFLYIKNFGQSINELNLDNLTKENILFIAHSDLEILSNSINQQAFHRIKLKDSSYCEVRSINSESTGKYWVYTKGKDKIFKSKNVSDFIEFPEKIENLNKNSKDGILVIESIYHIEHINEEIGSEFHNMISMPIKVRNNI